jgi:hypothetical protein
MSGNGMDTHLWRQGHMVSSMTRYGETAMLEQQRIFMTSMVSLGRWCGGQVPPSLFTNGHHLRMFQVLVACQPGLFAEARGWWSYSAG